MIEVDVPDRPATHHAARTQGDVNMSDRALSLIEKLALEAPLKRFLEVGVYKGVTTTLLSVIGPTVAVDWFIGNPEYDAVPSPRNPADENDRLTGFLSSLDVMNVRENVTILTGSSHDVLPILKNDRYGLIIVDADHSFGSALQDIRDTWDLLVPGGYLVLDDYSVIHVGGKDVPTVRQAWEAFVLERLNGVVPRMVCPANDGKPPKTVAAQR